MQIGRVIGRMAGMACFAVIVAGAILLVVWGLDGGATPPWGVH